MKLLAYTLSFIFLDAIVPHSCRTIHPPHRPEGMTNYEVITADAEGIEVYHDNEYSDQPSWRISLNSDSAVLDIDQYDTLTIHRVLPYTREQYLQFRDSLARTARLEYMECDQIVSYMATQETFLDLYDGAGNCYFQGHHLQSDTLYNYNFDGNMQVLHSMFTGLFPEVFE